MASEADSVNRLAAVTEKLKKIEADRAWNLSKEGKAANKRLKELQLRIKKEDKLLDKQAQSADKEQDYKDRAVDRATELERLEASISESRTKAAAKDRKADIKFNKKEKKLQDKLRNSQRNFGAEFYDSIFGTYSLIGSLKDMFPKPVQILAGWGFDKIKKGLTAGVKGIGKLAKGGFNAMMGGKPEAGASPEVKAAAEDVAPSDAAVPKKKLGPLQTWMSNLSGKGGGEEGGAEEVIAMDSVVGDAGGSIDELKKQTALLKIIAGESEEPDASKSGESILESGDDAGGSGKGSKLGGKFGKMLGPLFKAFKSIWKMVKVFLKWKTLVIVAVIALVGWLTVKFWEPIKKALIAVVDWFKGLWEWASAAISGAWTGLTEFIQGVWDGVVGWFKGLWAWGEKTGAAIAKTWTGVTGFIKDVWDSVIGWFKGLWTWASDGVAGAWTGITGFIKEQFSGVVKFLGDLFTWPASPLGFVTKLIDIILLPYNLVINFLRDIFGWGKDEEGKTEPFSIGTFIAGIVSGIWTWIKGLFGFGDTEKTSAEGEVEKPEAGWLATIFAKIFPKWLLSPIVWIKEKLGLTDAEGNLTDKGAGVVEAGKGGIGAMIGALFNNIFPEWIRSPIVWIKKKLGLVDDEGKLTDKAKEVVDASKGGIGAMISALFGDIFPEWITSPIEWIKKKIGLDTKGKKQGAQDGGWTFPGLPTLDDIKEFLPMWLTDPLGYFKSLFKGKEGAAKKAELQTEIDEHQAEIDAGDDYSGIFKRANIIKDLQAEMDAIPEKARGGIIAPNKMALVGELGPEIFVPHTAGKIIPNNQLTPGNDIAAASSNMYSGGAGGGSTNVIAPVTTNSSTSTIVNVQTPRMATDPNTQKQSGYALSGWAKFD